LIDKYNEKKYENLTFNINDLYKIFYNIKKIDLIKKTQDMIKYITKIKLIINLNN